MFSKERASQDGGRPRVPGTGTRVTASLFPSGNNAGVRGGSSYLLTKIVIKE